MPTPRTGAATRYAVAAASLAMVAGGTLLGLWALTQVLTNLDTLDTGDDSWKVMRQALATLAQTADGRLYAELFFGAGAKFQYAPTSLLPFEALGLVIPTENRPLNILNAALVAANAACLALLAFRVFASRTIGGAPATHPRIAGTCALVAGFIFYPVLRAFALGQIQVWIDLAFTVACLSWFAGRHAVAGIAIGLACLIKPQFGLFLVWGAAWRDWRFVGGLLLVLVPAGLASLARYGFENHLAYLEVLSFIARHGETFFANNSVNGILNRLLENGDPLHFDSFGFAPYHPVVHAATTVSGLLLMGLALMPALFRRGESPGILDLCFAALCFTMASPVAWEHHYGIMLPIFVVVLRQVLSSPRREASLLLVAAAWLCSAGRWPRLHQLGESPFNLVQAHLFLGAAMLLFVLGLAVFRRRQGS